MNESNKKPVGRPRGGRLKTSFTVSKLENTAISALIACGFNGDRSGVIETAVLSLARSEVVRQGLQNKFPELFCEER